MVIHIKVIQGILLNLLYKSYKVIVSPITKSIIYHLVSV